MPFVKKNRKIYQELINNYKCFPPSEILRKPGTLFIFGVWDDGYSEREVIADYKHSCENNSL